MHSFAIASPTLLIKFLSQVEASIAPQGKHVVFSDLDIPSSESPSLTIFLSPFGPSSKVKEGIFNLFTP